MPLTLPHGGGLYRTRANGADIRYLRAGTGTPVVLLHTLRTQLDMFGSLLQHLDTARVEVIAVDLPGHGESSAPPVRYTAGYFTDTAAALLEACQVTSAVVVGESIGGSIALGLAARRNPRVAQVIAINPYDYGQGGGIRRSSLVAGIAFTGMLWPVLGPAIAYSEPKPILRQILEGGLRDPGNLPPDLLEVIHRCGRLPGHPRAFRSLCQEWRTWITGRSGYPAIEVPVTLAYGDADWSRPAERDANAKATRAVRTVTLTNSGHFSSLEHPRDIAHLIHQLT